MLQSFSEQEVERWREYVQQQSDEGLCYLHESIYVHVYRCEFCYTVVNRRDLFMPSSERHETYTSL